MNPQLIGPIVFWGVWGLTERATIQCHSSYGQPGPFQSLSVAHIPGNKRPIKPRSRARPSVTFLELTRAFFGELEAYFCLQSSLAHMLNISSQFQHMDPVTLTEPLLLWERYSYSKWKNSLDFLSSFQTEHDSQGAGEHGKAEEFSYPNVAGICLWAVERNEKWEFQRNSHLTRSQAHIYHHGLFFFFFLKKRYPLGFLTFCTHGKDSEIPPSKQQSQSWAIGTPDSENQCLDIFHHSTMADYFSPNVKPWIISFNKQYVELLLQNPNSFPPLLCTLSFLTLLVLSWFPIKILTSTCAFLQLHI